MIDRIKTFEFTNLLRPEIYPSLVLYNLTFYILADWNTFFGKFFILSYYLAILYLTIVSIRYLIQDIKGELSKLTPEIRLRRQTDFEELFIYLLTTGGVFSLIFPIEVIDHILSS